jgi:thiol-disulfide isomerase/thioredoxin
MTSYSKALAAGAVATLFLFPLLVGRESLWNQRKPSVASDSNALLEFNVEPFNPPVPAPEFSLPDLAGNRVSLQDYRGKVVLLSFWATWCPPCRQEMPSMQALQSEMSDQGLVVLAANLREEPNDVRAFLKQSQLSLPAVLDKDGKIFERYGGWSLPTSYIIGRNGELLARVVGIRDWESDQTKNLFRKLLNGGES